MYATNRSIVRQLTARVTIPGLRLAADVAGLGCLVAAAWAWDWRAGLAGLGIVLLLLAARGDA